MANDIIGIWYHRQIRTYDIIVNIINLWYHTWYHIAQPSRWRYRMYVILYRRSKYDTVITYDIVGVTYDVVVTNLWYHRCQWPTTSYVARIQMVIWNPYSIICQAYIRYMFDIFQILTYARYIPRIYIHAKSYDS